MTTITGFPKTQNNQATTTQPSNNQNNRALNRIKKIAAQIAVTIPQPKQLVLSSQS